MYSQPKPDKHYGAVYKITCANWPNFYIGQTGHTHDIMVNENQKSKTGGSNVTSVDKHQGERPQIYIEEIQEKKYKHLRRIDKAIYIRQTTPYTIWVMATPYPTSTIHSSCDTNPPGSHMITRRPSFCWAENVVETVMKATHCYYQDSNISIFYDQNESNINFHSTTHSHYSYCNWIDLRKN